MKTVILSLSLLTLTISSFALAADPIIFCQNNENQTFKLDDASKPGVLDIGQRGKVEVECKFAEPSTGDIQTTLTCDSGRGKTKYDVTVNKDTRDQKVTAKVRVTYGNIPRPAEFLPDMRCN